MQKKGPDIFILIRKNDRLLSFFPDQDEEGNEILGSRFQQGFTLMNISVGQKFWKERLALRMGVKNVLNVQQVQTQGGSTGAHSGNGTTTPISPGRNLFVQVAFQLAWN